MIIAGLLPAGPLFAVTVNDGFDPNVTGGPVFDAALSPNGQIVIGGMFDTVGGTPKSYIARLNPDGSLDSTFSANLDNGVRFLAVQADGKVLISGYFTQVDSTPRSGFARLNSDGSLDSSFDPAPNYMVYTFKEQPDGKILIGGGFWEIAGASVNGMARLNSNGTLDSSFNNPPAVGGVYSLALMDDGRIVLGGGSKVVRLLADGTLDSSFSGPNINLQANSVAVQPNGQVVIGGPFTTVGGAPKAYIARLNANGTIDTSFTATIDINYISRLCIQADGKIIISGPFNYVNSIWQQNVARLRQDGSFDSGFIPVFNGGAAEAILQQSDGKIVLAGSFNTVNTYSRNGVVRLYHENGSLDATFSPGAGAAVVSVAQQPDGKILLGGYFTSIAGDGRRGLARLNPDGSLDDSFPDPNVGNAVRSIAVQPDGKILIGGPFVTVGGVSQSRIARLNSDGSLDGTFNPSPNDLVYAVVPQPDGKILVSGNFTTIAGVSKNFFARLNSNGSIDTSFVATVDGGVYSIIIQPDGKILIGGYFQNTSGVSRKYIARLNPDGDCDTSFVPNIVGLDVMAMALQADGKIVIGGTFNSVGGVAKYNLARLNSDGGNDTDFTIDMNNSVYSIALQTDGKILIGGIFTSVVWTPARSRIARINPAGSIDDSFNPGANNTVQGIAVQPDGKVIAVGNFTLLGGVARNYVARLTNTTTASYDLSASSDGTSVTLLRSGSGTEVSKVTFDVSTDLETWTSLGPASRITGGWEITGLTPPFNTRYYVRANADAQGGISEASLSLLLTTKEVYVPFDGHTLIVNKSGTGSGSVTNDPAGISCGSNCSGYAADTVVTLTPSAVTGSVFGGWTGDPDCSDGQVTMDADKTCIATFTLLTFSVTFSVEGDGNLTGNTNQTVGYGGSTTAVTANADPGNHFVEWSINDGVNTTTSTSNPLTISNVTANLTVKATFISNANFTAIPMSGEEPLGVAFTDTSTNNPTLWLWDFGDTATSTQRNPTHLFLSAGDYDVTLTTTASGIQSHVTKTIHVTASTTDPVQIGESEYPTLQEALDDASEGSVIEIKALNFTEDLVFWKDINITIIGGYDGSFTSNLWYTTIDGTLTITAGKVTIVNLIIQ